MRHKHLISHETAPATGQADARAPEIQLVGVKGLDVMLRDGELTITGPHNRMRQLGRFFARWVHPPPVPKHAGQLLGARRNRIGVDNTPVKSVRIEHADNLVVVADGNNRVLITKSRQGHRRRPRDWRALANALPRSWRQQRRGD